MAKVLHIAASPRTSRSASRRVAQAFLKAYAERHPDDAIEVLDLWLETLPEMTDELLNAKYNVLHGESHSDEEGAAWNCVREFVNKLDKADKLVISTPMWNFGIPYRLKHYLDVIIQPGLTFSFSPESGYTGLLAAKPVQVIYARGGEYGDSAPVDFQKPYLELALNFIGLDDIRSILVEGTLASSDLEAVKVKAEEEAKVAAASF